MEQYLLIIIALLIVSLGVYVVVFNDNNILSTTCGVFSIFFGVLLGLSCTEIYITHKPKTHSYKVMELERSTVFVITDSTGAFKAKDTVWVNYTKMQIDPVDSVAMMCVIVEEIKN